MSDFFLGSGTGIGKPLEKADLMDLYSEHYFEPEFAGVWNFNVENVREKAREYVTKRRHRNKLRDRIKVRDYRIPGTNLFMENRRLYSSRNPKTYERLGIQSECFYLYIKEKFPDVICMYPSPLEIFLGNEMILRTNKSMNPYTLYYPDDWDLVTADRIHKLIRKCSVRFIAIPISVLSILPDNSTAHAILLVYDNLECTLYHFDPIGYVGLDFDMRIKNIMYRIADSWGIENFSFYQPEHPGIQYLSETIGGKKKGVKKIEYYHVDSFPCPKTKGHCNAWTHFIIYLMAKNNLSPEVIFKELEKIKPDVAIKIITRFVSFIVSLHEEYRCRHPHRGYTFTVSNFLNNYCHLKNPVYTNELPPRLITWDDVSRYNTQCILDEPPPQKDKPRSYCTIL